MKQNQNKENSKINGISLIQFSNHMKKILMLQNQNKQIKNAKRKKNIYPTKIIDHYIQAKKDNDLKINRMVNENEGRKRDKRKKKRKRRINYLFVLILKH